MHARLRFTLAALLVALALCLFGAGHALAEKNRGAGERRQSGHVESGAQRRRQSARGLWRRTREIELVAFGQGINMLKFDAPVSSRVVEAQKNTARRSTRARSRWRRNKLAQERHGAGRRLRARRRRAHHQPPARRLGQRSPLVSSSVTLSIAHQLGDRRRQGFRLVRHRLADAVRRDHPFACRRRQPGAAEGRRGAREGRPGSRASLRPRPGKVLLGARVGGQRLFRRLRHQRLSRRPRAAEPGEVGAVHALVVGLLAVRAGARIVDLRRRLEGDRRRQGLRQESQ